MDIRGILNALAYSKTTFVTVNQLQVNVSVKVMQNSKTTFVTVNLARKRMEERILKIQKQHLLLLIILRLLTNP